MCEVIHIYYTYKTQTVEVEQVNALLISVAGVDPGFKIADFCKFAYFSYDIICIFIEEIGK